MSTLRVVSLETQNIKNSNSTVGISIDSAGRVKHSAQIAFFAYYGNGTSVAAGNVLIYPYTYFNSGGCFSTSNGRFTAPTSGYYHFEITAGGTDSFYFDLRKNGSSIRRAERGASNGGFTWLTVSSVLYLDINDYVDAYAYSGTIRVDSPYAGFSGHLIG